MGSPRTWDGVHPRTWDGVPPQTWDGVPPGHGMGYPPRPEMGYPPRQISIASTCYAAGGMPLAFTQEDFLVTVHVRSTREANIYTWECLSVHQCGWVPHPRSGWGGTPSQVWLRGYPIPGLGGTPSQVWPEGTPSQVWQGGTPSQVGVPHLRSGGYLGSPLPRPEMGYPPT